MDILKRLAIVSAFDPTYHTGEVTKHVDKSIFSSEQDLRSFQHAIKKIWKTRVKNFVLTKYNGYKSGYITFDGKASKIFGPEIKDVEVEISIDHMSLGITTNFVEPETGEIKQRQHFLPVASFTMEK